MAYVTLYAYAQPFQELYINLLAVVLLVDVLLLLMITSTEVNHCKIAKWLDYNYVLNMFRIYHLETIFLLMSISVGKLLQLMDRLLC